MPSLRIAITGESPTLDGHHSTAYITQAVGWHVYEGLFTLDKDFNAIPMLAEAHKYDDARKTYVLRLRQDVTFHDGSAFDADDVLASLDRWRLMFENVKEMRKTDPHTVEIELKQPSPIVPMMLAYPNQQEAIYPKEIVEKFIDGEIREYLATGPYRLVEHLADRHVKLARYDG